MSCNANVIFQVEKLMNRLLFNQYKLKKASISQSATEVEVEQTLFHGTSESSVKEICIHGFNRSFCGKNGMNSVLHVLLTVLIVLKYISNDYFKSCFTSMTVITVMFSLCSHCVWSRSLLCCGVCPVGPGPVLTPQCRWTQVCVCNQGADWGLHQGQS